MIRSPLALWVLACIAIAQEKPLTIDAPQSAIAGEPVRLRVTRSGQAVPNAELRIVSPEIVGFGVVKEKSIPLRKGTTVLDLVLSTLYKGEETFVLKQGDDGWCRIVSPTGIYGWATCAFLEIKKGPILGTTNSDGVLVSKEVAAAPLQVQIGAGSSAKELVTVQIKPLEFDRKEEVAPGITYRERRFVQGQQGPFTMQILEVDPTHPHIDVVAVRAKDAAVGRETMSSLAARYGATAAINGGYFVVLGPYAGASAGVYLWNGQVLGSGGQRSSLLLCREKNGVEQIDVDVVNFQGRYTAQNGNQRALDGLNRPLSDGEFVAFSSLMGKFTRTPASTVEAVLEADGTVREVLENGNAPIPEGGHVLAGTGTAAEWIRANVVVGSKGTLNLALARSRPDACNPSDVVGGGPRLVRKGKVAPAAENLAHEKTRHPRTAVASTRSGKLLFVTVDGRQSSSVGMTITELAEELIRLDAVEAVNLDGGGSTAMVVKGRIRNSPSDGSERPVSDGLLIFSDPKGEQPRPLTSR
jgi:exopolysaccharide biosynthesis protein